MIPLKDYLKSSLRVGIVAAEASGDLLGADLVKAIQARHPEAVFVGIAGPRMQVVGVHSMHPMERLSVMGLFEPLKRARELLGLRRRLAQFFIENPPHVFIGIDAPDFNLNLERKLKDKGIPTVHYVSPTIWAWRPKRIHAIKKAVDHMLLIFPFEKKIYDHHQVSSTYVGHMLAQDIPLEQNKARARENLNIGLHRPVVALLPGSREGELRRLSNDFLLTVKEMTQKRPDCLFLAAMTSESMKDVFQTYLQRAGIEGVQCYVNQTRTVLEASCVAMVTSGTATLETALHKVPHIVVYRVSWFTYLLAKRLIKTPFIAMTNIVAQRHLVTEYIQKQLNPKRMADELIGLLDKTTRQPVVDAFYQIHRNLIADSSQNAAEAVLTLVYERSKAVA